MSDPTEDVRRQLAHQINAEADHRERLEARYGQVWNTSQLAADFEILGFGAPFVVVRRLSDGRKGSLMFQHHPRLYFNFEEHR